MSCDRYEKLVEFYKQIEKLSGRLDIIKATVNFFKEMKDYDGETFIDVVYLCSNTLWPSYMGKELNIGDHIIMLALSPLVHKRESFQQVLPTVTTPGCGSYGVTDAMTYLQNQLKEKGDLGTVAQGILKPKLTSDRLLIHRVFTCLRALTEMDGKGVQERKVDRIQSLFDLCKDSEIKYLVRTLQGNLRIGLQEATIIKALAETFNVNVKTLEQAFAQLPNYELIIEHLFNQTLDKCTLTPGIPIKPMLGKPIKEVEKMFSKGTKNPKSKNNNNQQLTLEYKYDGERAQIHKLANGKIQVYSRNSEDNTSKYPDVIERLASFKLDSYILDAEIVAYDVETHSILPFQTLSTRKRKDASQDEIKVQVAIFAFDLLFLNGKSIMDQPLKNRRDLLHRHFDQTGCHYFFFASYKDMENKSEVESYMKESINNKCEGLMVKQLMDPYVPNKRSWFKIKKDYVQGITDTLDLVPIGGFYGKGKRTGVYGAFLLACYYKQNGMFQSITKIGTGFSDEDLDNHFKTLSPTVIKDDSQFQYSKKVNPDVWFRPTQVWEVLAADLSLSPVHMAACGRLHKTKGIALRFPRFIRVRDDKSVHDATDSNQVLDMFTNQKNQ